MVAPRSKIMAVANDAGEERAMIGGGIEERAMVAWWGLGWKSAAARVGFRRSEKKERADAGAAWKTGCGAGSCEEDGRDRGGVALPSPALLPSSPTAPSSSIIKFALGSSLLSPPSPDPRP
jgi:hypothetical protein